MSLERNIERIADALEAIARSSGGGAAAYKPSQGNQRAQPVMPQGSGGGPVQPAGNTVPVSHPAGPGMPWQGAGNTQQQAQPVMPQGGQMPAQQPGAAFQQPAAPGMVPTATASAKPYTFDQLAVATANLASSGKDVFAVLGRFGVSMLMDLPPEKYGEYAAALREAGAVI